MANSEPSRQELGVTWPRELFGKVMAEDQRAVKGTDKDEKVKPKWKAQGPGEAGKRPGEPPDGKIEVASELWGSDRNCCFG